jgi:hypothetical protein
VKTSLVTGPDGNQAAQVEVTYPTPQLIPIMSVLPEQLTIHRTVTMRIRSWEATLK